MSVTDFRSLFFTGLVDDPQGVIRRARSAGFTNESLAEVAAWTWELAAQVQVVAAALRIPVLFMGGGGAQMRFNVAVQRGSRDADFLVAATREQLADLIRTLEQRLEATESPPFFRFELFTPSGRGKPLPMRRYDTRVPSLIRPNRNGHAIKLEFHLRNDLPAHDRVTAAVFAFARPIRHDLPVLPYQIAMKLMTVTSNAAGGVPLHREAELPKQFYDLDHLFAVLRVEDWPKVGKGIIDLAKREQPTPVTQVAVWSGIRRRLDDWADTVEGAGPKRGAIAAYNQELPRSQRIPLSSWRIRLRRLRFATTCAEVGDARSWATAQAVAASLRPADTALIAARWAKERGTKPPTMVQRADALWWEYLGTGGTATPLR